MATEQSKLSVLLASTDNFFRQMILEILDPAKYSTVVVETCGKALESLADGTFDLVILDPDIRPLSGSEVVPLLKKLFPKLPLIVATDDSSYENGERIAESGVYFRLSKPINQRITSQVVQTLRGKLEPDV